MGTFTLTGYHGTDKSAVDSIIKNGFHCKQNNEHWLGQGIYLYYDRSLAEWWTTNPTQKHGINIVDPAVIACEIEIDESRVLNLCTLDGYKKYVTLYNSFFQNLSVDFRPKEEVSFRKVRCAFFNFIFLTYQIDVVIAPFVLPKQPYMPICENSEFAKEMHILYTEVQVCICEDKQGIIKNKTVIELGGGT